MGDPLVASETRILSQYVAIYSEVLTAEALKTISVRGPPLDMLTGYLGSNEKVNVSRAGLTTVRRE